jgi:transcriptional regulator with PAS, ATPase and Fis domain
MPAKFEFGATLDEDMPTLVELAQDYIEHVLARHDGNKTQAAKALGLDRRSLYRWLNNQASRVKPRRQRGA